MTITADGDSITLRLTGDPSGPVSFELPAFVNNIAATTSGTVSESAGAVTINASTRSVTVKVDHAP